METGAALEIMEIAGELLERVHRLVWGPGLLILMLGTGILYTGKSRGFQIFGWKVWWSETIGKEDRNSGFQTACTALAATIGTGNIVGVATALKAGGPGAVFWMWISALLGMMTGYAEVWLGIHYRYRNKKGRWIGGAVTYLAKGLKTPWLGAVYGFFCLLASLGMGGMVQSNGAVQTLKFTFGVPAAVGTLAVGGLTVAVLAGGKERIMRVTERLIPLASTVYVVCAGVVILASYERIPMVLAEVFRYALLPRAVAGGVGGYGIRQAVRYGIARGVFSNEAGLGSLAGAALAAWSFGAVCGKMGEWLIALAMLVFSFATMIAWFYLGRQTLEAMLEVMETMGRTERIHQWYFYSYSVCIVLGGLTRLEAVWKLSDIWNGLMAFPNLLALFWLQRQVHFPWTASRVRDAMGKSEFRFRANGKQRGKP